MVPHQRVVQPLRQASQFSMGMRLRQQMRGQMGFALQLIHVLLDKMLLHRLANQEPQAQQHRRGDQRKHQRDAKGDGAPTRAQPAHGGRHVGGSSST